MESSLLNIGCGSSFHSAWVNVDMSAKDPSILKHNLLEGLPFPDESFTAVYHSHVLEHFTKADGKQLLKECFRVLTEGGILRIAIPDLERIAREYLAELDRAAQGDAAALHNHERMTLEMFDQMVRTKTGGNISAYLTQETLPNEAFVFRRTGEEARHYRETYAGKAVGGQQRPNLKSTLRRVAKNLWPKKVVEALALGRFRLSGEIHQWMYDRVSLGKLLTDIGFHDVAVQTATSSNIPSWNTYLLDANKDGVPYKPDSLYVEARK